jgi:hypothetical protein
MTIYKMIRYLEETFIPRKCSVDTKSKNMIVNMLDSLEKSRTNTKPKFYTNTEFDSRQTLFEFVFNNEDINLVAASEEEASVLLYIVDYVIKNIFSVEHHNDDFVNVFTNWVEDIYGDKEDQDEEIIGDLEKLYSDINNSYFDPEFINKFIAFFKICFTVKKCGPPIIFADANTISERSSEKYFFGGPQEVYEYPKNYKNFIKECKKYLGDEKGDISLQSLKKYILDN